MLHFCEYNLQLISTLLACIFDSLLRFSLLRVVLVTAVRSDPINKRLSLLSLNYSEFVNVWRLFNWHLLGYYCL